MESILLSSDVLLALPKSNVYSYPVKGYTPKHRNMTTMADIPAELLLQIFEHTLEESYKHRPIKYKSLRSRRGLVSLSREEQCRNLMDVCKIWHGPAKLLLWREFKLKDARQVRQLAQIEYPSFRDIRYFEVAIPQAQASKQLYTDLEYILLQLPPSLHLFSATLPDYKSANAEGHTLFDLLFLRPKLSIRTKQLMLGFPSELHDISKMIARFTGFDNLSIQVDQLAHKYQYHSTFPMHSIKLRSLHLEILQKEQIGPIQVEPWHADNLSKLLTPACSALEKLKISITDTTESIWYRFNRLAHLGSQSLQHLELRYTDTVPGRQAYTCVPAQDPRAYDTTQPNPFPNLKTLVLHEFGLSSNLIGALSPFALERLRLVVPPKQGMGDGWEGPEGLEQVLDLLPALKTVEVRFAGLSSSMFEAIRVSKRRSAFQTRKLWADLEEVLYERGVDAYIHHPDIVEERKPTLGLNEYEDEEDLV